MIFSPWGGGGFHTPTPLVAPPLSASVEDFAKTMAARSYSGIHEKAHASRQLLEYRLTITLP